MISEENAEHPADNSAVITKISYIWKYIKKKTIILHCKYCKLYILLYFLSNKCSIWEKNRLPTKKNPKKSYRPQTFESNIFCHYSKHIVDYVEVL